MNDGPKSLADWTQYLHAAAQVKKDSADYGEAREAIAAALRHIHALHVQENNDESNTDHPGALSSLGGEYLHTLSAGTGELFSGIRGAAQGSGVGSGASRGGGIPRSNPGSFGEGAQEYRESMDELEASNPTSANIGGALALLTPTPRAAGAVKAGVPLTLSTAGKAIGREAGTGAAMGALSGFSSGGAEAGDMGGRVEGAKKGAILGLLLGGLGAGGSMVAGRRFGEARADLAERGQRRAITEERLGTARAQRTLTERRLEPALRAKQLPIRGQVSAGPPGPIDPILSQMADVNVGKDAMDAPTFIRRETGRGLPTSMGGTMEVSVPKPGERAPGGGRYVEPGPYQKAGPNVRVESPRAPTGGLIEKQIAAIQEQLAQASPADRPILLRSLKDMGMIDDAQLAQLLGEE